VFLLDMGESVKIIDLARNMIRLAGHSVRDEFNADGDIAIEIVGMRPGEKLYEELLIADSNAEATAYPKIMKAKEPCLSATVLAGLIDRLRQSMAVGDEAAVRSVLMAVANSGSPKQQQVDAA
jgi:FlaA1/EpsC-like NDP-sugar epimerase